MRTISKKRKKEFEAMSKKEKFEEFRKYEKYVIKKIHDSGVCNITYKNVYDLLQEVYCNVWLYLDNFNITQSSVYTDITILTDSVIKYSFREMSFDKRDGYNNRVSLGDMEKSDERIESNYSSDNYTEEFENSSLVAALFKKCTEREQEIFEKRFYEGKTLKAIGEDLNLTKQRIDQIIQGVKKKVKEII